MTAWRCGKIDEGGWIGKLSARKLEEELCQESDLACLVFDEVRKGRLCLGCYVEICRPSAAGAPGRGASLIGTPPSSLPRLPSHPVPPSVIAPAKCGVRESLPAPVAPQNDRPRARQRKPPARRPRSRLLRPASTMDHGPWTMAPCGAEAGTDCPAGSWTTPKTARRCCVRSHAYNQC